MTIGSTSSGGLYPARAQDYFTSSNVTVGGNYGNLWSKSWNGGDSFPTRYSSRWPQGYRRKVARTGEGISVYNTAPAKGKRLLTENSWNCTIERKNFPEGGYYFNRYTVSNGAYYDRYGYKRISFNSVYNVGLPPTPTLSSDKLYQSVSKVANAIRGSEFNASVFAAQFSRTYAMIGDSANRISRALLATRKGNLVEAFDHLVRGREGRYHKPARFRASLPKNANSRSMSANWLALQYGWKPLLKDVHGAAEMLAHQMNVPFKKRYTSTVSSEVSYPSSGWPGMPGSGFVTISAEAQISRKLIVEISAPPNMTSILGLENPLSVAWEVLPWSFVIDWFIPIGNFLQANADVRMLQVSKVITTDRIRKVVSNPAFVSPVIDGNLKTVLATCYGLQGYKHEYVSFSRSIGSSLSVPLPEFKPLNKSLTIGHALNAVALLTQRFTSK